MNVSGPLLMLLLTAACTVSGQGTSHALWQFGYMIWCVQPDANPFNYIDYGCYCGPGGQGEPVDEVDQCCKVHDECYGACMKDPECKDPYYIMYDYTCSKDEVTCSEKNSKLQAVLCECDRAAALCFARAKFNPEYYDLDQKLCEN